jgi:ABC-type multidrug transport system permease subunit
LGQISATWNKTIKEFLRQKTVLFWTIGWPIIWVLIGSFSFTSNVPSETLSYTKGAISISMMVFALMTAGMANLPGNIVQDRERGLLRKIMSMPISPWRDFTGRIMALLAFSGLSAILVIIVGFVCGARFFFTGIDLLASLVFVLLVFVGSAGIGMLIGTFVKHVHGAIMSGVGLTVVSAALSGVMTPYSYLPSVLQSFAKLYPISSANSAITFLLVGEEYAGYNPLGMNQTALTALVALLLFILGMISYSRVCWKKI